MKPRIITSFSTKSKSKIHIVESAEPFFLSSRLVVYSVLQPREQQIKTKISTETAATRRLEN